MTAAHIVDPERLLGEALCQASPDLMRSLLQTVINALLSAEADAVCGAEYGQASPERGAQRNGYRHRDLDTRVGTIDVAVPRLRTDSYFPDWLLERRKPAESALITVVADAYLAGVSTRRMDKLVGALGINSLPGVTGLTHGGRARRTGRLLPQPSPGQCRPIHLCSGRRPDIDKSAKAVAWSVRWS